MNKSPETAVYEIRIQGHLSARRAKAFSGLAVTLLEDGSTMLRGPVQDQAALHGFLVRIRDMGLPLLSLQRRDSKQEETKKDEEGNHHEPHT